MIQSIQQQFFNACVDGDAQEALSFLSKAGQRADAKAADSAGDTALIIAASYGHADCVRALLTLSDAKAKNINGYTALMFAAKYGHADCVSLLLPHSNIRAANNNGYTACTLAKMAGHLDIVLLIKQYVLAQKERKELGRIIAASTQVKQRSKSL